MIFGLVSPSEVIAKRFQAAIPESIGHTPNYNLQDGNETLFLSSAKPFEFISMRYGMTPFWTKEERIIYEASVEGKRNVASDGILKSGIILSQDFRKPIREQRGLLPVDYFIVQNKDAKPYCVFMRNKKRPFAIGCAWDAWKKEILDPLVYGYAILTTPTYGEIAKVGIETMPLIIREHNYKRWLKTETSLNQITPLLNYYDEKDFNAYPIGPEILTCLENEKKLISPAGEFVIQDKKEEIIYSPHGHKKKKESEVKLTMGEKIEKLKNV